jgi:DNA mismatch repair protein MutS
MFTPVYQQYRRLKEQYPDCILFFQLGDFYETFEEDAHIVSQVCDVVLTSREFGKGHRLPLAGVPVRSADPYISKLVEAGYKVAICQQTAPAGRSGRQLFDREVVRVVTAGTLLEAGLLDAKANNYIAAVVPERDQAGLAYADVSTGEFAATQDRPETIATELARLQPAEVLVAEGTDLPNLEGFRLTRLEGWAFGLDTAEETLKTYYEVASLAGFGLGSTPLAVRAAGGLLKYLQDTQRGALGRLRPLKTYSPHDYMVLDPQTRRNLEIFRSSRSGSARESLLSVIDLTRTAMGGRLLRAWLGQPRTDLPTLQARLDAVEALYRRTGLRRELISLLGKVGDLERSVYRVGAGLAGPRELAGLRSSLEVIPRIRAALGTAGLDPALERLAAGLDEVPELVDLLRRALVDDPPAQVADGGFVRPGFSAELDELHRASRQGRQFLAGLERTERERTGIKSLRVGYNKVFGYYLEVTHAALNQPFGRGGDGPAGAQATLFDVLEAGGCGCRTVRDHLERCLGYIRKQTLVGAERYISPELKEYESLILNAQERSLEIERQVFNDLCRAVREAAPRILQAAQALAELDVYTALAEVAVRRNYIRPELDAGDRIEIVGGRHPVVEALLPDRPFVPNDTLLDNKTDQVLLITGPNMAGKSTYLRQVALIVLMAQVGSFVPAERARIGLVDRIFSRIGAQDEIATGQSTFMVEMTETALILRHATPRSLVILDEIGRGTSTYDGLAIARAVVEKLHNDPTLGCKTLFATHYHELTALADELPRVKNYRMEVLEEGDRVVFLYRVAPGGADRSYGLHVARLAGIPPEVVARARALLLELEASGRGSLGPPAGAGPEDRPAMDPELAELLREVCGLDLMTMTPIEALNRLYALQQRLQVLLNRLQPGESLPKRPARPSA